MICETHKKEYVLFCTSDKCSKPHAGICSHQDCSSLHDHPIRQTITIAKLKQMIIDGCFPLNELIEKIKVYFQQIRKIMIQNLLNDQQKILNVIRRYQYCQQQYNYNTLINIIEQKYSNNTSSSIWKLFTALNDPHRRERIKQSVNKYQQQLNYKYINKLFNTQAYKYMVLNSLSKRSDNFQSAILPQNQSLSTLLKSCSINTTYYKRIFSAKQNNFDASKYHQAVDSLSPTITIIKANNHIFGCFLNTKVSITNTWIADSSKKSFIFSLDNKSIHPIMDNKQSLMKAVYGGNQGPQIGSGLDIYISDKCNIHKKSGARLGGSYQLPNGIQYKSVKADKYLAGEEEFLVQDYQVFSLI